MNEKFGGAVTVDRIHINMVGMLYKLQNIKRQHTRIREI